VNPQAGRLRYRLTLALSQGERGNALSFWLFKTHVCNTYRRSKIEKW
jgi:hypothetical protein